MYVNSQVPVLLQTAQLQLYNPATVGPTQLNIVIRAIMDSGSQRTYITSHLRDNLNLSTMSVESLRIKTFGSAEALDVSCDVVKFGLVTNNSSTLIISALVAPFICNPLTSQPISYSMTTC